MIETTDRDEVAELRAEHPDEPIMLTERGAQRRLLYRPGVELPQSIPLYHKARYADGKERPY